MFLDMQFSGGKRVMMVGTKVDLGINFFPGWELTTNQEINGMPTRLNISPTSVLYAGNGFLIGFKEVFPV